MGAFLVLPPRADRPSLRSRTKGGSCLHTVNSALIIIASLSYFVKNKFSAKHKPQAYGDSAHPCPRARAGGVGANPLYVASPCQRQHKGGFSETVAKRENRPRCCTARPLTLTHRAQWPRAKAIGCLSPCSPSGARVKKRAGARNSPTRAPQGARAPARTERKREKGFAGEQGARAKNGAKARAQRACLPLL